VTTITLTLAQAQAIEAWVSTSAAVMQEVGYHLTLAERGVIRKLCTAAVQERNAYGKVPLTPLTYGICKSLGVTCSHPGITKFLLAEAAAP
jgi:hypothetical protein